MTHRVDTSAMHSDGFPKTTEVYDGALLVGHVYRSYEKYPDRDLYHVAHWGGHRRGVIERSVRDMRLFDTYDEALAYVSQENTGEPS